MEPYQVDESITGSSLVEWSPQQQAIEVAQANPGLCAVLENAALLFASGQAPAARALLEQGVASDHDTKQSPLAWLALFDLLQRAGDRAAFDQHAFSYSVQFERSAPTWEARTPSAAVTAAPAGFVAVAGSSPPTRRRRSRACGGRSRRKSRRRDSIWAPSRDSTTPVPGSLPRRSPMRARPGSP